MELKEYIIDAYIEQRRDWSEELVANMAKIIKKKAASMAVDGVAAVSDDDVRKWIIASFVDAENMKANNPSVSSQETKKNERRTHIEPMSRPAIVEEAPKGDSWEQMGLF